MNIYIYYCHFDGVTEEIDEISDVETLFHNCVNIKNGGFVLFDTFNRPVSSLFYSFFRFNEIDKNKLLKNYKNRNNSLFYNAFRNR